MIRLAAFLLALAAAPALGAVTARDRVSVEQDTIMLGDVFDGVPADKAAIPVMKSPAPGQRTMLDTSVLSTLSQAHGLGWAPTGATRTVVERTGQEVPRDAVIAALTAALAKQGMPAGAELSLDNDRQQFVLPAGSRATVSVSQVRYDPAQGRFQAMVSMPANDPNAESQRVSGRVAQMVEIPVLGRTVIAGETIRERDLDVQRIPATQVTRAIMTDSARIVGRTARRTLVSGQPLKAADLNVTHLVAKNAMVNVRVVSGTLNLVMQGKALDDGAEGDQVRVVNTRSNRTVQGVVTGPNLVTVQTGLAAIAN